MNDSLITRDVFARHTDKDGNVHVSQHLVWDSDRFFTARRADAAKEGGKADIQQITAEQYRKERK
ncbi:hypothetical protein [Variovorax sp. PMC12]|uniref:hypothetical protein n=1 Tax=Variovorax sp. PMC12 TaxID=2126319 RepID=UPI000D13B2E4|nr:hypothetical protein [Variovorax sp. PMC12]AVQ84261.1 hypothetical protein C4F17_26760 [Variovorax sp. PMC12]